MTIRVNQRFEGPGFDNGESWTENAGVDNSHDEDAPTSEAGNPPWWQEQCLWLDIVSPANKENIVNDWGAADPIVYVRLDVLLDAESLGHAEVAQIAIGINNAGTAVAWVLYWYESSGALYLLLKSRHDGADNWYVSINSISLDTVYTVEIKWDATADKWAWRIDGTDQRNDQDSTDPVTVEGNLTSTHVTDIGIILIGNSVSGSVAAYDMYVDLVTVSIDGWLGATFFNHLLTQTNLKGQLQSLSGGFL